MNSIIKPISIFTFGCSLAIVLSSAFCSTYTFASAQQYKQVNAYILSSNIVTHNNLKTIEINNVNSIYFYKPNVAKSSPVLLIKDEVNARNNVALTGLFKFAESNPQELLPYEVQQDKGNEFFELAIQFNDKLQLFVMYVKQLFSITDANASDYTGNTMNNTKAISQECKTTK